MYLDGCMLEEFYMKDERFPFYWEWVKIGGFMFVKSGFCKEEVPKGASELVEFDDGEKPIFKVMK